MKKLTTEEFIEKAQAVHDSAYDYLQVDYQNSKIKVEIICSIHGSFWQSPNDHLSKKAGCPKCGKVKYIQAHTMTTEEFINRATELHKGRYDYSRTVYVRNDQKVEIICNKHGGFWQTPSMHLRGNGCKGCRGEYMSKLQILSLEEFLQRAKEVHGDKYDYSQVVYNRGTEKIEIICPIHGSFWQQARSHYLGSGCAKCAGVGRLSTDEFIQKAKEVHRDKYGYSKVDYTGNKTKVEITCYRHGSFFQSPNDHLDGAGCPSCERPSFGEEKITKYLQQVGISFMRQKKFNKCRDKRCLPFDFFFQIDSLKFLVEYDGIQHFEAIETFGGKEGLERNRHRDAIRNEFAARYDFILIRIPYTKFDNIEMILREEIERCTGQPIEAIIKRVDRKRPNRFDPGRYRQGRLMSD